MDSTPISLVGAVTLSFATTYLIIPYFNQYMQAAGIVGTDIMKKEKKPVADMGGPGVITGFLLGVFFYIGLETFITHNLNELEFILASLCTVLIITQCNPFLVIIEIEDNNLDLLI